MFKKIAAVLFSVIAATGYINVAAAGEVSYGKIKASYDKTAEISISYGESTVATHLYYYFRETEGNLDISTPSYRGFEEPVVEKLMDEAGNEIGVAITWKVVSGPNRMKGLSDKDEQFVKLFIEKDEVRFEINLIPSNPGSKGYGEIGLLLPEDAFSGGSYKGIYVSGSGEKIPKSGDMPIEKDPPQPNTKTFETVEITTGSSVKQKILMRIGVQNYKKLILQDFRSYERAPWAGNWRLVGGMDKPLGKDCIKIEFEEQ